MKRHLRAHIFSQTDDMKNTIQYHFCCFLTKVHFIQECKAFCQCGTRIRSSLERSLAVILHQNWTNMSSILQVHVFHVMQQNIQVWNKDDFAGFNCQNDNTNCVQVYSQNCLFLNAFISKFQIIQTFLKMLNLCQQCQKDYLIRKMFKLNANLACQHV